MHVQVGEGQKEGLGREKEKGGKTERENILSRLYAQGRAQHGALFPNMGLHLPTMRS